ncbi:cytotoxic and regulatory T-cell molecule [Alligator sinensis]|uniref:Cytotoxic and regulatory T-cell molecule n=1 Tax=Alligator sinensis TaxID=38654 RepID=A0A3Q0GCA7_ALLSI|nr:cytotoxic and regulatory T-cell molecule [Alligator sinensis]
MTFITLLCLLALLPLQGDFQPVHKESVTVEEGKDLKLLCNMPGDSKSDLQWSNPQGFIIFLNTHRGLRDQRFELIHYSKDELLVSLSKIRVQDEGVYTCFDYGTPVRTKTVNVMVLAAPSKPQLEASDIIADGKERNVVLTCSTQGSKPPPRITWLLDNGIEVSGDTKHRFEHDGKKCNTTSTLTVHAYGKNSIASCVVRHETFREEKQMVSFRFEHLVTTTDSTTMALEMSTRTSENHHYTETEETATESMTLPSPAGRSLATSAQQEDNSSQMTAGSDQSSIPPSITEETSIASLPALPTHQKEQLNITTAWSETTSGATVNEEFSGTEESAISEEYTQNYNVTTEPQGTMNDTDRKNSTDTPTVNPEEVIQNYSTTGKCLKTKTIASFAAEEQGVQEVRISITHTEKFQVSPNTDLIRLCIRYVHSSDICKEFAEGGKKKIKTFSYLISIEPQGTVNGTDRKNSTDTPTINTEEATQNYSTTEIKIKSKEIGNKNKKLLLPILVSLLILGLLIIVLLFMRKLKKAHGVWKRENDASEQTLESYKSRSNEDNPVPEKNGQGFNQKSGMQYVTNGYAETIKKQPGAQDVSVFAKQLASGRETDV